MSPGKKRGHLLVLSVDSGLKGPTEDLRPQTGSYGVSFSTMSLGA